MQTIQQAAHKASYVPIEYIGTKPEKHDNINHTTIVWKEPGDVQPYPKEKAAALLRHSEIWKLGRYKELTASEPIDTKSSVAYDRREPEAQSVRDVARAGPDAAGSISTATGKRGELE